MFLHGGTTRQSPHETLHWTVSFEAGGYLLMCRVADAEDMHPHVDHGMVQELRVLAAGR